MHEKSLMDYNNLTKKLSIYHIFFIGILIRFLCVLLFYTPGVIDELVYKTMALGYHDIGDGEAYTLLVYGGISIPNFLYSKIISVAFYFGDNFQTVIKFINVVFVSLCVFPAYSIVLKHTDSNIRAKVAAILIVLMPFNMISTFAMPESLYFFLTLVYIYFMDRYICDRKNIYVLLATVDTLLLVITKPHGMAIILAMAITLVIFTFYDYRTKKKWELQGIVIFCIIIIASTIISIKGNANLGTYTGTLEKMQSMDFDNIKSFLILVLGHISVISLIYGIPIIIVFGVIISAIKQKNEVVFKFLFMLMISFACTFAMVMKFSNDIGPVEGYTRLHARYYFFFYAIIIIAFFATYTEKFFPGQKYRKMLTSVSLCSTVAFAILIPRFLNILVYADNADLSIFFMHKELIYILSLLASITCIACLFFRIDIKYKITIYTCFLICMFVIGNIGQLELQLDVQRQWKQYYDTGQVIRNEINNPQAKVYVIFSNQAEALMINFYNQFNYLNGGACFPTEGEFDANNIPSDAEYVVCVGNNVNNVKGNLIRKTENVCIYDMKI